MKKKQIIYFLSILLAGFIFSSCGKDFTGLTPESQRNATDFYQSQSDFNTSVMGAYASLKLNGNFRQGIPVSFEMQSDNASNGAGASGVSEQFEKVDLFQQIATGGFPALIWSDSYKGIDRCNNIIKLIDNATFDETLRNQYKGEALFVRSLLYYNLAIIFGNVQLKLDVTTTIDRNLQQVDANTVYSQIVTDLTTAASLLPPTYSAANRGRATSWAAKTLEAKALLMAGKKAEAKPVLTDIINNGPYKLLPNFADVFGTSRKNGAESIFEVQYLAGGRGLGSMYTNMFVNPRGDQIGAGGGNIPFTITTSIRKEFEAGDKRLPVSIIDTSSVQAWWIVPKYIGNVTSNLDGDANWIVMRYADVILMMAEVLGAPAGYPYINQIRTRAGLPSIGASGTMTYDEQLLHERRVEFAFEGQRWPDLIRFGAAKKVMAKALTDRTGTPFTVDKIKLLFPIPQQEIDNSTKLIQNPDY
jgi:hypothetical protein